MQSGSGEMADLCVDEHLRYPVQTAMTGPESMPTRRTGPCVRRSCEASAALHSQLAIHCRSERLASDPFESRRIACRMDYAPAFLWESTRRSGLPIRLSSEEAKDVRACGMQALALTCRPPDSALDSPRLELEGILPRPQAHQRYL